MKILCSLDILALCLSQVTLLFIKHFTVSLYVLDYLFCNLFLLCMTRDYFPLTHKIFSILLEYS